MRNENRKCYCGQKARPGQADCTTCHAAYMRDWRPEHPLNDEQRRKDIARSKVGVYVRRGKIVKTLCACGCGSADVKARILDYNNPVKSVQWLCAESHAWACRTGHLPLRRPKAA